MKQSAVWTRSTTSFPAALAAALSVLALADAAHAGDGRIELSHTRALVGDASVGDSAGYPIQIFAPGSYVLTSNLVTPNESTSAISISTSGVHIDLNGFTIRGVTFCSAGAGGVTCSPSNGVNSLVSGAISLGNVTLENGTISNGGSLGADLGPRAIVRGVRFHSNRLSGLRTGLLSNVSDCTSTENGGDGFEMGSSSRISSVVANSNGGAGIDAGTATTVLDSTVNANFGRGISGDQLTISRNTVNGNQQSGILVDNQATISGNSVMGNTGIGIICLGNSTRGCSVLDNTITGNTGTGLAFNGAGAYQGNTINGNGATVESGIQTGGNVCDGDAVCP
ncbi:MAG: right-handed parallel beta-helix repeat-containing protein [Deltaproteobacteria bacterium]|nr:right-handed parallel beta-helix repeat-containing protein [Deltaproteobacteria bacterium]